MSINRRHVLASSLALLPASMSLRWSSFDDKRESGKPLELTERSRAAVNRGFQWLRKTETVEGGHGTDIGRPVNIGCTAVTGLAMLADGSTPMQGPHKAHLKRIVRFLIETVERMPTDNITHQYGQLQGDLGAQAHTFFALLFLSQVAGEVGHHKQIKRSIQKLVDTVVAAQTPNGDWGQEAWAPILGTVMGWTSLRSAHLAGFRVGGSPRKTAQHLIGEMKSPQLSLDNDWMHSFYKSATGVRVLYAMGMEKEPVAQDAFKRVMKVVTRNNTAFNQAGGEEYLAFHLITETMLQKEDDDWYTWFPMVRDKIVGVQNKDGSWTGHHCITSRTFCTAAACLVLSAPNRFLPISQS